MNQFTKRRKYALQINQPDGTESVEIFDEISKRYGLQWVYVFINIKKSIKMEIKETSEVEE